LDFFEKIPKSNNHWFWLLFQKLQRTNDFHERIYAKKLHELWKVPGLKKISRTMVKVSKLII
jgi:hypothetical protein